MVVSARGKIAGVTVDKLTLWLQDVDVGIVAEDKHFIVTRGR